MIVSCFHDLVSRFDTVETWCPSRQRAVSITIDDVRDSDQVVIDIPEYRDPSTVMPGSCTTPDDNEANMSRWGANDLAHGDSARAHCRKSSPSCASVGCFKISSSRSSDFVVEGVQPREERNRPDCRRACRGSPPQTECIVQMLWRCSNSSVDVGSAGQSPWWTVTRQCA